MRIGINAIAARAGGGLSYLRGILPHLAVQRDVATVVFTVAGAGLPPVPGIAMRVEPARGLIARTVWEQVHLPAVLRRDGIDILFAPGNQGPVLRRTNFVVLVQSVDPLVPPWRGTPLSFRAKMLAWRIATLESVRRARTVVAVSEHARALLAEQAGIDRERIEVVPHGGPDDATAAPSPEALARVQSWGLGDSEEGRYVLAVSNVMYNKNYPGLIRAFARARRLMGRPLRLAIAGTVTHPWCLAGIHRALREEGVEESVRWLGWVEADVRRALYARAAALLFPSHSESFGLPALEAMAYGVPVIASPIPALHEVCAEAAVYADPDDPDAISATLVQVLDDGALRDRLTQAGRRRAERYTWAESARRTVQILCRAAGSV